MSWENFMDSAGPASTRIGRLGLACSDALPMLLDQSLDCIKVIGLDGTIQYINRNGVCAMELESAQTILGLRWTEVWPIHTRSLVNQSLADAEAGKEVRFEAFCPTAKGSPRWWDVSVSKMSSPEGQLLGYLSISRDITPARAAQNASDVAAAELASRLRESHALFSKILSDLARENPQLEQLVETAKRHISALDPGSGSSQ